MCIFVYAGYRYGEGSVRGPAGHAGRGSGEWDDNRYLWTHGRVGVPERIRVPKGREATGGMPVEG